MSPTVVHFWSWLRDRWAYTDVVSSHDQRSKTLSEVEMIQDDLDDVELVDAIPIRRLQPGDTLDVVIKLRKLLSMIDTTSYTLYASFAELGNDNLDKDAEKARHTLELAASRMNNLLNTIEKTPTYVDMRKETLARRKERERGKKG